MGTESSRAAQEGRGLSVSFSVLDWVEEERYGKKKERGEKNEKKKKTDVRAPQLGKDKMVISLVGPICQSTLTVEIRRNVTHVKKV